MGFFAFAIRMLFLGALPRAAEVSIVLPEKKQKEIDRNKRIKNTPQAWRERPTESLSPSYNSRWPVRKTATKMRSRKNQNQLSRRLSKNSGYEHEQR